MSGHYSKYIKLIHLAGDLVAMVASIALSYLFYKDSAVEFQLNTFQFFLFSLFGWTVCTFLLDTYEIRRVTRRIKVLFSVFKAALLYIIFIEAGLNILNLNAFPKLFLLYNYFIFTFLIASWRLFVATALRSYRKKGYNNTKVIIVGVSKMAEDLEYFFRIHPEFGFRFMGFFDDEADLNPKILGSVSDVEQFIINNEIDQVYCCPSRLEKSQLLDLINFVDNNLVRMKLISTMPGYQPKKLKVDLYDVLPVLIMRTIPLDDVINKLLKRAFDIVFSLTVIVFLLSWLLPILALVIKLTSKGPVFFKQVRSGIDNKNFECYKLRSMYVNKEANLLLARRGDSRVTPVGAFLRKTSLDELPQFFNVLLGHMSIVGPRPHMLKLGEEYAQVAENYMVRHFIKPGVTGLSQVRGYRGDTTATYQIRGRTKLDIFYLENWTFLLDLKIIFYTIYNVIRGDKAAF